MEWVAVGVGAAVVLGLAAQVGVRTPEGFIARVGWTMLGIVAAGAVATLVVLLTT